MNPVSSRLTTNGWKPGEAGWPQPGNEPEGVDDTHPEARAFQLNGWRQMTAHQRLGQLRSCWRTGRVLQAAGRRMRGETVAEEPTMEQLDVTRQVTSTLESAGVRYLVVGSVASSIHGEPRYTQDTDLVAELTTAHRDPLLALAGDFYLSEHAVQEAIERRSSFNLIHLATNFKIDIFVSKSRPFDRSRIERRTMIPEAGFYVATPEDVLLAKLEWYRLGNEVSERQWRDIEGIVAIQPGLDHEYLRKWAPELGVEDLLHRLAKSAP